MCARPFHLSGISIGCSGEDEVDYYRDKGIAVTGFFLPAVGNKACTAKLFAVLSTKEQLLVRSFCPEYVVCHLWEASPPATKQNHV